MYWNLHFWKSASLANKENSYSAILYVLLYLGQLQLTQSSTLEFAEERSTIILLEDFFFLIKGGVQLFLHLFCFLIPPSHSVLAIECSIRSSFLSRGWFYPLGDIWQYLKTVSLITTREECYWHLEGRSQVCCYAQDGPPQSRIMLAKSQLCRN